MTYRSAAAILVAAAGTLFATVPSAEAVVVQYSTTGVFSLSGTNRVDLTTVGGGGFHDYVQFTGVNNVSANVGAVPVNANLGNLLAAIIHDSSGTAAGTFTLTIDQTVPGPSNGSFAPASFSGTLSRIGGGEHASGELVLTFVSPTITLDGIQYSIAGLGQGGLAPNQLGLGLYNNALTAAISMSAVPEPAFEALIACGLAGICFMAIRRKRFR